jgi:2Fe-2S ferredoxin
MTVIKILPHAEYCPEGREIQGLPGNTLCETLLDHGVAIEHACDQSCACTTCHVIVRQGLASLNEATEEEDDLLDQAWGLQAQSRLSCQVILGQEPLVIEIPKYTINHAKELH